LTDEYLSKILDASIAEAGEALIGRFAGLICLKWQFGFLHPLRL
jgi:hypothetical protein